MTTRLLPKTLFQTDEGRAQVLNLLLTASKTVSPYIPVVAPVLFNATANSTSVTPAWREALWHVSLISQSNLLKLTVLISILDGLSRQLEFQYVQISYRRRLFSCSELHGNASCCRPKLWSLLRSSQMTQYFRYFVNLSN